jgi:hypothetical protein
MLRSRAPTAAQAVTEDPTGRLNSDDVRLPGRLRTEVEALERMAKQGARGLTGSVKIAVAEGLGTFWLIPRLIGFQRRHPDFLERRLWGQA